MLPSLPLEIEAIVWSYVRSSAWYATMTTRHRALLALNASVRAMFADDRYGADDTARWARPLRYLGVSPNSVAYLYPGTSGLIGRSLLRKQSALGTWDYHPYNRCDASGYEVTDPDFVEVLGVARDGAPAQRNT